MGIPDKHHTKEIKAGAFVESSNLAKIFLPNALEKIGDGAFESCDMLERLTIPRSVKVLEGNPFSKWDGQLISFYLLIFHIMLVL